LAKVPPTSDARPCQFGDDLGNGRDFRHARRRIPHLRVSRKGEKTRNISLHAGTNELIHDYLDAAGHGADDNGALFRPIKNNRTRQLDKALTPDAVYPRVRSYSSGFGRSA
jgi:integrase/recombinase XerD